MNWKRFSSLILLALTSVALAQSPSPNERAMLEEMKDQLSQQADHWFNEGDFPRAIEALRMRYALAPDDLDALTDLGWMLESTDRSGQALALYGEFRRSHPENPDAVLPEAEYYNRKRLFAKIPPLLEGSLKPNTHANGYRILAGAYERLGRLTDSLRVWESYIKINPNDAQARVNRDRVKNKIQKKDG